MLIELNVFDPENKLEADPLLGVAGAVAPLLTLGLALAESLAMSVVSTKLELPLGATGGAVAVVAGAVLLPLPLDAEGLLSPEVVWLPVGEGVGLAPPVLELVPEEEVVAVEVVEDEGCGLEMVILWIVNSGEALPESPSKTMM